MIATLFRSNRARDRSHYETFRGYHEALYRSVEPTSVTPWSVASRDRSLAGALAMLLRHVGPSLAENDDAAKLDLEDTAQRAVISSLIDRFVELVVRSDAIEADDTRDRLEYLLRKWDMRAREARDSGHRLVYDRAQGDDEALFKRFGQQSKGWLVADSMRSVEPNVAVEVREPFEEGSDAADQA